jgi:enoyl-CoA hydratase/carnithine racemase
MHPREHAAGEVLVVDDNHLRTVTISNPKKKNALTRAMLDALAQALVVDDDVGVRALLLAGDDAGGGFSAGFDITTIDDDERARGLDPIAPVVRALAACPVPVVVAVDGPAMGGALEIAMAATLRVAGPTARFLMPPSRLGLVYAPAGLQLFLDRLDAGQVARLFLAAEPIGADEALRIGLVDVLVDDARVEAHRLATRMAAGAPLAVRGMTLAIHAYRAGTGYTVDDLARIEEARARSLASSDLVEGVAAFREKRAPLFHGR